MIRKMKNGIEEGREDERQIRIDPAEFVEHDILRDHDHLERQHHGKHHTDEPDAFTPELNPCKSIGNDRGGYDASHRGDDGNDGRLMKKVLKGIPANPPTL